MRINDLRKVISRKFLNICFLALFGAPSAHAAGIYSIGECAAAFERRSDQELLAVRPIASGTRCIFRVAFSPDELLELSNARIQSEKFFTWKSSLPQPGYWISPTTTYYTLRITWDESACFYNLIDLDDSSSGGVGRFLNAYVDTYSFRIGLNASRCRSGSVE